MLKLCYSLWALKGASIFIPVQNIRTVNTTVCDPEDYWSSSADGSVSVSQEERALDKEAAAAAATASSGSSSTGSAH